MTNTITGTIIAISDLEQKSGKNGTYIRQRVFLDSSRYNQQTGQKMDNKLLLDFFNPKENIAQRFKKGDSVQISFNLRGYCYNNQKEGGKKEWGVNIACYKIEPWPYGGNKS